MLKLISCAVAVLLWVPAAAAPLQLLTEDAPPFNFIEDGRISGIAVDLVRATAARANIEIEIDLLPWQRAYADALEHADTCVFSTTVTDERRPLFKWVGPLVRNDWALIGLTGRHFEINSLEEAKPYLVGVYEGDARESFLAAQGGFRLSAVGRNDLNSKLLEAGRIDLWASSTYQIWNEHQRGNFNIEVVYKFKTVEVSAACNKQVPDATINRLNAALAEIRRAGLDQEIEAKYGVSTVASQAGDTTAH